MLKKRASNARFAGVCSGVLFAVLGAAAAGFAEEANAQEVQASVFFTASGNTNVVGGNIDFSDNLSVMFNGLSAVNIGGQVELVTPGLPQTPGSDVAHVIQVIVDGELPQFGTGQAAIPNRAIREGDLLLMKNLLQVDINTFRVYRKAAGGLFLAATANPPEAKAAADLDGTVPEFFLSETTWDEQTTLAICGDDAAGYTGPDCLTAAECDFGVNMATNQCNLPTADNCAEMSTSQVLDSDTNMCRLPETDAECAGLYDGARPEFVNDASAGNCQAETQTPEPPGNGGGEMPGDNTGGGGENGESIVVSKDERDFPVVGAIVMGVLMFGLSQGGEEGEFSYSPSFGYSVNESGYSAKVGGRMDFRKDEWTLFYTGGQANANGEFGNFRYSSGGEYRADFWQASFSESVQGETADYDLSLSADLSGGVWSLSPVYRLHSRLEEGESETRNSLNLEGVLRYEDWRITPSAGFGWRRAEDFGDSAKFRLEAVREF